MQSKKVRRENALKYWREELMKRQAQGFGENTNQIRYPKSQIKVLEDKLGVK